MRWKLVVAGLALMGAVNAGCKQPCLTFEADLEHMGKLSLPNLENTPNAAPPKLSAHMPTPSTVSDPDRKPRYVSLAECIAIALQQGNIGIQNVSQFGFASDNLVQYNGRDVNGSDNIRVLRLDPAIAGSDIESSLSKFDALYTSAINWNTNDQPLQGLNQFNNGQAATFSNTILKPLPTGGVAGITFSTQYQNLSNPPNGFNLINPAYTPSLQFAFEQPLLQGFGVEINELRTQHPNSILTPFASTVRSEGILITRIKFDQTRVDFERAVAFMLVNVETAYWNLYGSYWSLYSREQGMRQAYEAFKINKLRFEAGKVATQELAQSQGQYELFRAQRISALEEVLEAERQLRNLLNLPADDGTRLITVDPPTLTPYKPDWTTAYNETMALRPELILARNDLKLRQLDVINQKNLLLPDLRFTSTYSLTGIGSRLDGEVNNAFRSLAGNEFQSWNLGLRFSMPIGFRDAHAQERIARLNLTKAYQTVVEQEDRAARALLREYRRLDSTYRQIEAQRSVRQARAIELEARTKEYLAGRGTLDFLLQSQSQWADALRAEYASIVQYNNSLAAFEFQKGTVLRYDNVNIGEGPLPPAAQVRAIEHDQERSHALLLRQREAGVPTMPTTGIPALGSDAMPISAVYDNKPVPQIEDLMPVAARSARPPINIPTSSSAIPASTSVPESLPSMTTSTSSSSPIPLPAASGPSTSNSSGSIIPPSSSPYTYGGTIPRNTSPYATGAMPGPSSASSGMLTPSTPPAGGFNTGSGMKLP